MPTSLATFLAVHLAAQCGALPIDDTAVLTTTACIRCHPVQAQEWFQSPHRTAFTEATFQSAIAIEPAAFCRGCHAPQADPTVAEITPPARLGVGCISCHVREDRVVSWKPSGPDSPHTIERRPRASSSEVCQKCHEFVFPDSALRDEPLFMQLTVTEHAQSKFAAEPCVACHMEAKPDTAHRSHEFLASRSPAMVRRGVRVETERPDATTIVMTLRAGKVGHAFPTGDLFRRVEVGVQTIIEGEGETGPSRTQYLARHFGTQMQSSGVVLRGELHDNRVPATGEPRVIRWSVPEAAGHSVRWWVDYQRVAHHTSRDPRSAFVDGTIRIAQGTLPAH
ncbi:MAG: hypothetical protein JKY37_18625 [Nannocystaceae bacterium]|nr:hypothetical protein [Nannocystaceae bacterium]